ncbi:MAG TPA: hypothetical protein VGK67_32910 [Myxococcales bacterium]|jgi:hypothetical protein
MRPNCSRASFAVLVGLTLSLSGCDCGGPASGSKDTGGATADTGLGGGGGDGAVPACLNLGESCTSGVAPLCCDGRLCVQQGDGGAVCSAEQLCGSSGTTCTTATDCCSLNCSGGQCVGATCKTIGTACGGAGECCSGVCTSGSCAAIPNATCKSLGETCARAVPPAPTDAGAPLLDDAGLPIVPDTGTPAPAEDCCSGNCAGGRCVRASACSTAGDICYEALDCCNGTCNIAATGGPGTCAAGLTVPGGTGCTIGGELCDDSGGCCSHMCLDLGSGVQTCVLGGGCRERGEICQQTEECCGNDTSNVVCQKASAGDLVGRCANSNACQPIGNCCGASGANCRQDCCNGKKTVCKDDQQGLSRCFGGCPNDVCPAGCPDGLDGTNPKCCIAAGSECQFRDQCCDLTPCLPDNTGKTVCKAQTCVAAGATCTPGSSTCCNGLSCEPNGEIGYSCRVPGVLVDGGVPVLLDDAGHPLPNDGGTVPTGDAGPSCKGNGTTCAAASDCCSNSCIAGELSSTCQSCKPDTQSCTAGSDCCSGLCQAGTCVPPTTCVSQGGVCSGTAECCAGTVCDISAGQPTGLCNPGATCSSAGQTCSATQPCCNAGTVLRCENTTTNTACAATDVNCACRLIVN